MKRTLVVLIIVAGAMLFGGGDSSLFLLPSAYAHCDTLDGPVVKTARAAIEKGDVTPVLKWVKKENEPEIRDSTPVHGVEGKEGFLLARIDTRLYV